MNASDNAPLLVVEGVTKRFPGVTALDKVSLSVSKGEVLALIGENGAGKSTLMKILAGVQRPDEGAIRVDGRDVSLDSVQSAQASGIALIHQELNLSGNLSVAANMFLGREPLRFGLIDTHKIQQEAALLLERVGLDVSPETIVDALSIGQQQLVEIARALSVDARVLIMDEPTSSLSQHETERLMEVVKDLRSRGVSIIYISHRLGEVKELADRVTVFRDGKNAGDLQRDEINHDRMVRLMVGRDISQFYARTPHQPGDIALEVQGLRSSSHPACELNFRVRAHEIVGIAGLVGAGRTELLEVLFGVEEAASGTVSIGGREVALRSPLDAIQAGVALVPENRKQQGIILEMSVRTNIGLAGLRQHRKKAGFLNQGQEARDVATMIERLRIKTPDEHQVTQYLSGGNQQKVVLGKWLAIEPKVLLLDEPTRGIDVGAKQEIYRLMDELAKKGVAILFVSSEMEEILGMSDRTLVMHEGRITGELLRDQLSEEAVMQLATGRLEAVAS
ncbi:MAG: sugar ABC transporter ATP-binding protein [Pirellulales bacterium]|nr:sugar ABC transporter ATP-binding protein [Pirellulales bacterium]